MPITKGALPHSDDNEMLLSRQILLTELEQGLSSGEEHGYVEVEVVFDELRARYSD